MDSVALLDPKGCAARHRSRPSAVHCGGKSLPSDDDARPAPVRVVLPAAPVLGEGQQEVTARL
jgi:hypothetical protein